MVDDIVTRLREIVWDIRCSKMDSDDVGDIVESCLDEIERLRKTIHDLMEIMEERRNEIIRLKKELANDG